MIGIKDNQDGTWTAFVREKDPETGVWKKRQKSFRSQRSAQAWRERQVGRKEGSEAFRQSNITETREGKWKVSIDRQLPGGDRYRRKKTFPTLEAAEAWREAAHAALDKGVPVPEPDAPAAAVKVEEPTPELVAEAVERWFTLNYTKRLKAEEIVGTTYDSMRRDINAFVLPSVGSARLSDLTPEQVEAAVAKMAESGYAKSRQNRLLFILNRTYELSISRGWANINPSYGIKARRAARVSTYRVKTKPKDAPPANRNSDGTVKSFHDISPTLMRQIAGSLSLPVATAAWMGYLCGMRSGEALGLRMCDVDPVRRLMFINGQGGRPYSDFDEDGNLIRRRRVDRTKGPVAQDNHASRRLLYIPECLLPYIETIHSQRVQAGAGETDPFLVGRDETVGLSAATLTAALKRVSKELLPENTHLRPHDLRKNAATNLTTADVRPFDLSVWMGHRVGAYEGQAAVTAAVYIQNIPSDDARHIHRLRAIADLIDQLVGPKPLIPTYAEDAEWLTAAEAAERLATNSKSVLALAEQGILVAQQRYLARNRRRMAWHVTAQSVEEHVARQKVGLTGLAARFGIRSQFLKDIAEQAGIPVTDNRGGRGSGRDFYVFTDEAVAALETLMEKRAEFLKAHIDKTTVMETTGLSRNRVESLIRAQVLVPVIPDFADAHLGYGSGQAMWFSRTAVKEALPRIRKAMSKTAGQPWRT